MQRNHRIAGCVAGFVLTAAMLIPACLRLAVWYHEKHFYLGDHLEPEDYLLQKILGVGLAAIALSVAGLIWWRIASRTRPASGNLR